MSDGPWSNQQTADALLAATETAYRAYNTVEADPYQTIDVLTGQRDSARNLAVALEAHLARISEFMQPWRGIHADCDCWPCQLVRVIDAPLPEVSQ